MNREAINKHKQREQQKIGKGGVGIMRVKWKGKSGKKM